MTLAQYPGIPPSNASGNACADRPAVWSTPAKIPLKTVPCEPTTAHYTEKLQVGYRWYEAHDVTS